MEKARWDSTGVLNAVLCVTSKMGQHRGTEHCYLCNRQDGAGVLNTVLCVTGKMGQGYLTLFSVSEARWGRGTEHCSLYNRQGDSVTR